MACAGNDHGGPGPAGYPLAAPGSAAMTAGNVISSPYLEIFTEYRGRRPVLRLAGELDVGNKDLLESALGRVLERRPQTLVVDLAMLGFMDCSGLSVLVQAHQRLTADQGRLFLTGSQPIVRRLISLLELDACLRLGSPVPC